MIMEGLLEKNSSIIYITTHIDMPGQIQSNITLSSIISSYFHDFVEFAIFK